MQSDPLQQLRDIHLPADAPGWWPPAPGWWLVAAAGIALLVWLFRVARQIWRRRAPIRRARALHAELAQAFQAGTIDARGYVDGCNELLKRLFIHGLGNAEARRLADDRWLQLLDAALGEPAFSSGPGRSLGPDRFAPTLSVDVPALIAVVNRLLARVKPPRRGRRQAG